MKKIKFFVLAILIIIGLLIFNFYISFSYGSFGGFLAQYRTLPKEEKLELLRSDAIKQIAQAHADFSSFTGLTLYEETYSDMCAKGEHSWKIDDLYANTCSYRLTRYYGTNREYKELLLDLEKTLPDFGWAIESWGTEQPTISESISEYSGEIFLVELPVYTKKISDNNTYNYAHLTINGFNGYGGTWTKTSKEPSPLGFGIGMQQEVYRNESNKSPKEIFNRITSSGLNVIMIAISKVYFEN